MDNTTCKNCGKELSTFNDKCNAKIIKGKKVCYECFKKIKSGGK